jgi:hypothetical protein
MKTVTDMKEMPPLKPQLFLRVPKEYAIPTHLRKETSHF